MGAQPAEAAVRPPDSAPAGAGAEPAPIDADQSLHRKLVWLTFFRLVMVTVLLGGTAAVTWQGQSELLRAAVPLYGLVAGVYLVSLAFAVVLRRPRWEPALAHAQVATDVGVAAAVVAMTGHAESVFVFMFLLAIVNGSILLFRRGAAVALALSAATYLALVLGAGPRSPSHLALFVHLSAFAATAALSGYLAEQLRRTGERLEKREGDLAAMTALHEAIVQSVSSGIVTLDAQGRIIYLNRAAEEITGLTLAEVAGRPSERWFPAFATGGARDETQITSARGEALRIGFTLSPLVGRDGEHLGSTVVFQDLTRLREMEEAVQRSERLADVGRLAAGLAHELRNPLASMSGCVELLRGGEGLGPEEQRLLDIVLRESSRLEQLVERFLAYSRPAPPRRVPTDLAQLLREVAEVFSRRPDPGAVRVEAPAGQADARCDPDQIRQVAWNLLLNAVQAVEGGGRGGRVRFACGASEDGGAWFRVEDDGPGISPDDRVKLFTPFFTTKPRGTGLGLATIHRIVEGHGGAVTVESEPGRGTRFTVRLPPVPAGGVPG